MKVLKPIDAIVYEFDDLEHSSKEQAMGEVVQLWLDSRQYRTKHKGNYEKAIDKAEEMKTPWFAGSYILEYCEKEIIRFIKENKYLYNSKGEVLPITYNTKDGKISSVTIRTKGGLEVPIEIKPCKKFDNK